MDDTERDQRLAHFRQRLEDRRETLKRDLDEGERRRRREDSYAAIASEVPDSGDSSVAIHQMDLRHAEIGRDLGELRAVEAALVRIEEGEYGECTDCGVDIPDERLEVAPFAERCVPCQTAWESQHAGGAGPTI